MLGWDLTKDSEGLTLYESSLQRTKTSNHTSPLAISFLAALAHWRLKQHGWQQLIWNILACSPFMRTGTLYLRERGTERQTDRQMDREKGVLWTVRINRDFKLLQQDGEPRQSHPRLHSSLGWTNSFPLGI